MKTKVMGMFALLVIALSVAGFAYAHWSDMVTIDGTAEMGSLTFGFTKIVASWDSEDYNQYPPEKHVAEGVCTLSEPEIDVHSNKTVYKLLTFTITGGYPQYWAINKFTLDNAGTIPVKIQRVTIILPPNFTAVESTVYPSAMWEIYDDRTPAQLVLNLWLYKQPLDWGFTPPDWGEAPPWEFPGPFGDQFGVRALKGNQIEPCNELLTEVCVDIKQPAEMCHTYTFSIEIEAIQWNKYTDP
ncbi:MAG: hypothetical protein OEX76_00090 [Candidatus Bathyarchaeota archaeon]|nr:hypothetical protein [Candidatus Bathyarchaeota archaeon]MDH5531850.1 hypothetical protein [Candidatus Bathyarchaeota archaeon]MDH5712366.1 hypothetical protein [Candidatus Bathyarchaeota archaeon]